MYSSETIIGAHTPQGKNPPIEGLVWPEEGLQCIPEWVYTSEAVYAREVERIFHGRTWNFVALPQAIATDSPNNLGIKTLPPHPPPKNGTIPASPSALGATRISSTVAVNLWILLLTLFELIEHPWVVF